MAKPASNAEMEVLAALLESGAATAVELHAALAGTHPWSYSTVVTLLRRLEAKGLARHEAQPGRRAFLYRPTSRAPHSPRAALKELLRRAFGGNPLPLVSSLLEETKLSKDQLAELSRLIEEHKKTRRLR